MQMASRTTRSASSANIGESQSASKSAKVNENDSAPSRVKLQRNDDTKTEEHETNEGDSDTQLLKVEERVGDIFDAPNNSVLIHACNCEGSWGAGIAAAFKKHYPKAFQKYRAHCNESSVNELRGTAFLIEPCEDDDESRKHFVGCLFTSGGKGRTKDKPNVILERTGPTMRDLLRQIGNVGGGDEIAEVRMCRINSGLFNVPWNKSKAILEDIQLEDEHWPSNVIVYSLE